MHLGGDLWDLDPCPTSRPRKIVHSILVSNKLNSLYNNFLIIKQVFKIEKQNLYENYFDLCLYNCIAILWSCCLFCFPSKHLSWWRRLENVFWLCLQKTSLRRFHQDQYIYLTHTSSEDVFKTSWSRPIYSS